MRAQGPDRWIQILLHYLSVSKATQGNVETQTISDVNSFSEINYKLKLNAVCPYFATMGFFSLIFNLYIKILINQCFQYLISIELKILRVYHGWDLRSSDKTKQNEFVDSLLV